MNVENRHCNVGSPRGVGGGQSTGREAEYPRLLILVTGKGPQREQYVERMRGLDLRRVAFRTLWLESADYPRLLGSCDLGVSLHTSSSGYDLPMKVCLRFSSLCLMALP